MSKKDEIIESAFLLFLDYGIDNVSITKIIEKVNISNGGFFHYFKTKNDLIVEIMETYVYFYFNSPFEENENKDFSTLDKIKLYYAKSIRYDLDKKEFYNTTYNGKKIDYKKLCVLFLSSYRKNEILKDNFNQNQSLMLNTLEKIIDK
ncbi:TetR/AcrR family transcriptional regulator, partial [Methanobrevibacter sp. OttesenSCG-928-I08]|nr:TetR/AcrR family transcriptional regulator [Methanobrevibacter sp. OttesenSCG-928-I08]